jgi:hypothetical protein
LRLGEKWIAQNLQEDGQVAHPGHTREIISRRTVPEIMHLRKSPKPNRTKIDVLEAVLRHLFGYRNCPRTFHDFAVTSGPFALYFDGHLRDVRVVPTRLERVADKAGSTALLLRH